MHRVLLFFHLDNGIIKTMDALQNIMNDSSTDELKKEAVASKHDVVCSLHCCGSGTTGVDVDDEDELALPIVDVALGPHVAPTPYAFVEGAFHLGDGEHEQLVPAETVLASADVAVAGDAENHLVFHHQPDRCLEGHFPVQAVPLAQTAYVVDSLLPVGRVVADAQ
ncbi:hypothetical protein T4B_2101 [Trichinella pseudospiralis]|uniref:Uncharacterized protein n=2 Tax=Trichinella pseudospiralis TaxID=6337 RepID=A0A0V1DXQ8_TRIPS|nr:hypothetical protein T4A_3947 [Trichinella pseudospiralis]KRY90331.1 hypothetical protein T4D_2817 [Trichinella pseudospiralis]KRZ18238.1 hypothetical protein T4B_2101 [Trichinella pseudospiralis]